MKEKLIDLLTKSVNSLTDDFDSSQMLIERPKLLAHGDFSTNIALTLAKSLKKPPREIAQLIIDHLDESEVFEKIEIAGAGFINFYLNNKALTSIIQNILKHQEGYGSNTSGQNEKIQIEFVSANPTGPLHVGHGRGAAIGDCLARLFEFSGWQVTREFYYNDAGAQIDNLTKSVMARCNHIEPSDSTFPEEIGRAHV